MDPHIEDCGGHIYNPKAELLKSEGFAESKGEVLGDAAGSAFLQQLPRRTPFGSAAMSVSRSLIEHLGS